jgi:hypothetical protein
VDFIVIDMDSGTNGTGNGGRRANIETKLPEVMLGVEFRMFCTTKHIETAEDREETNSAKIGLDGKVVLVSGNGRFAIGWFQVDDCDGPVEQFTP